jgi:transcriptional regulator with XRE-family HTH domain
MKDFSEKLKKRLKELGMTQYELCERIQMTPNGLKRAIDNESLTIKKREEICVAIGVDELYFVETKTQPIGVWKRLLDEANTEAQRWKMRAFELEEKMSSLNFRELSRYVNPFFCANYKGIY